MKTRISAICASVLLCALSTQANITGVTYSDDGDGAILCPVYTWGGTDSVGVYGDQYSGPGHIDFNVTTDTELDPTLGLFNAIDNDTTFAWTGYQLDIWMDKTFTISGASILLPAGWSVSTAQPVFGTAIQDGNPVPNVYIGHLFFSGGAPVAVGGALDFSYAVSFLGSVSFTEQLTPVPEPSLLSLLVGGSLLVAGKVSARRPR